MNWKIEYSVNAIKDLKKLDKPIRLRIFNYLEERILSGINPRLWGKKLQDDQFKEIWRYRVGDYRVLCTVQSDIVVVTVVSVGHRKEIYQ